MQDLSESTQGLSGNTLDWLGNMQGSLENRLDL